ncbi:MAG: hypothetical protein ACSHX7_00635 [Luteolibacter sp.]
MTFEDIYTSQFTWGLLLGLLIAGFILKSAIGTKMQLKRQVRRAEAETRDLQSHLNTQMKITASGSDTLTKEVETLKAKNENLRVNLALLQNKPDKNEARQFHMQEMAISTMREQAPGFAGAWEKAMRQAETDMESAESGFSKLVRKVVPSLGYSGTKPTASEVRVLENDSGKD